MSIGMVIIALSLIFSIRFFLLNFIIITFRLFTSIVATQFGR